MNLSPSEKQVYNDLLNTGMANKLFFDQFLDMDDDPVTRYFSFEIVEDFFQQGLIKLPEMSDYVNRSDGSEHDRLKKLYEAAHYLKGSSSTMGLQALPNTFEAICGATGWRQEESGPADKDLAPADERLLNCAPLVMQARDEFVQVRPLLLKFWGAQRFGPETTRGVPESAAKDTVAGARRG